MTVFRHRSTDASPHGTSPAASAGDPSLPHGDPTVPRPSSPPGTSWLDAQPGPLLTSGTRADVYALDDGRVLRRYRSGASAADEVAIVRQVTAHGYPAPEVYWAHGPEIVMERFHGPTLLQAMAAEEVTFGEAAAILADLHSRLHAIPAPGSDTGGDVVVHLDLHPGNVILVDHEPCLVDWSCARGGTAELDVATTALIIAEVVADGENEYSDAARAFLVAFLGETDVDPRPALPAAARHRIHESRLVAGEEALVPAAETLVRHYAALRHAPHQTSESGPTGPGSSAH
jgi:tRNA A-37 threonylcarbamoyl transferase component Bud32